VAVIEAEIEYVAAFTFGYLVAVTDAVAFHSCLWDDDFISAYLDGDSIEERCPQCDNIEAAHRNLLIHVSW